MPIGGRDRDPRRTIRAIGVVIPRKEQVREITPGRFIANAEVVMLQPQSGYGGRVFGDPIIATAILNRLLHHSHVVPRAPTLCQKQP